MATAAATTGKYGPAPALDEHLPRSVWQAPLVGAALAVTSGIALDHYLTIPLGVSLAAAALSLVAWACVGNGPRRGLGLVYLALAGAAFGAAYHRYWVTPAADDIAHLAGEEPRIVQVRGVLDEEPFLEPASPDPLRSFARGDHTTAVLRVTLRHTRDSWQAIGGRVRLSVGGRLPQLHVGDEVEVVGLLSLPEGPANPGEMDYAAFFHEQGISALLVVKTADGVTRLGRGWHRSLHGWLAVLRGRGQQVLMDHLSPQTGALAAALLLGDGAPMSRNDWDRYLRTGVIHVLAISGQHLVILAAFLWFVLPRLGLRQRHAAIIIGVVLFAYALLTGGRPPALRSAIAVAAICGAIVLRRRTLPANLFALAWLAVALVHPANIFTAGCLLSFLSVAVLVWGTRSTAPPAALDPAAVAAANLDRLIDQARPAWERALRGTVRQVAVAYLVCLVVWLAVTPLAASRFHVVSLAGLVLGPPLVFLSSIALLAGFGVLAAAVVWPVLAMPLVPILNSSLLACEALVEALDHRRLGCWYVADIPEWWLWLFYLGLLAVLTQVPLRRHWPRAVMAGLGWVCVGLAAGAMRLPDDELRCTFLAVGHGGATVLETPDGRVLLYDAGALGGPDVTRRVIAPYLWSRGVRHIDEVFLSHADLDHFNGLDQLLERFAVGRVTTTPSFSKKDTPGVEHVLARLEAQGVAVAVATAGDVRSAGAVRLEVLHPPGKGPEGNENARSLVLSVQHAGHEVLLTGDLEGPGQQMVLASPRRRVDVLMAPHHGSRLANTEAVVRWARPQAAVACQGPPRWGDDGGDAYRAAGVRYLSTWRDGAVTVHSHPSGLAMEAYRTGERFAIRKGPAGKDD